MGGIFLSVSHQGWLQAPNDFCCSQVNWLLGGLSSHSPDGGWQRPHVRSQYPCMKPSLHLPKDFCCWHENDPGGWRSVHSWAYVATSPTNGWKPLLVCAPRQTYTRMLNCRVWCEKRCIHRPARATSQLKCMEKVCDAAAGFTLE